MPKTQNKETRISLYQIREAFKILCRFSKYLLRYWKFEIVLFLSGNLLIGLGLINPYLAKLILDQGILGRNTVFFIKFSVIAGIIFIFGWAFGKANGFLSGYIQNKVRIDLTQILFKKINKLALRFFQGRSTGELIFRINSDINSSTNIIIHTLPNLVMALLRLIYITIIISFINYKILLLVLGYQVLLALRTNLFTKKLQEIARADLAKSQDLFSVLSDFFSHIYFVKATGTGYALVRKYFSGFFQNIRREIKAKRIGLASESVITFSDKLFFGLAGLFGSLLVIKGKLTLGSLGAIMAYIGQGAFAYAAVFNSSRTILLSRIPLERLSEILDAEIEVKEKEGALAATFLKGEVEFKNVSFSYEKEKYVLENLTFNIAPQGKIAIVGQSGRGKTTILNLLLRLYDCCQGAILIDGHDVRDLKFKALYNQTGISLQEPFLFNESVKDNICFGQRRLGMDRVVAAAGAACAHEFIVELPDGYETVVGENACKISQGQKQRIAIARALIKRPKILILDEAMSSLDSETEDRIIENIKREFVNSTVMVVSHRLSTAKKMEMVYFLESPSCVQIGTHQELMERSVKYKELFASQIEAEIEPYGAQIV